LRWHGLRYCPVASAFLALARRTCLKYWRLLVHPSCWLAWISCSIPFRSPSTTRRSSTVGSFCLCSRFRGGWDQAEYVVGRRIGVTQVACVGGCEKPTIRRRSAEFPTFRRFVRKVIRTLDGSPSRSVFGHEPGIVGHNAACGPIQVRRQCVGSDTYEQIPPERLMVVGRKSVFLNQCQGSQTVEGIPPFVRQLRRDVSICSAGWNGRASGPSVNCLGRAGADPECQKKECSRGQSSMVPRL